MKSFKKVLIAWHDVTSILFDEAMTSNVMSLLAVDKQGWLHGMLLHPNPVFYQLSHECMS